MTLPTPTIPDSPWMISDEFPELRDHPEHPFWKLFKNSEYHRMLLYLMIQELRKHTVENLTDLQTRSILAKLKVHQESLDFHLSVAQAQERGRDDLTAYEREFNPEA